MLISKQVVTTLQSGGDLSDITHGPSRLALAKTGFESIARSAVTLTKEIDAQFDSFKNPMMVSDLYQNYQQTLGNLRQHATEANSILQAASRDGKLSIAQSKNLETLSKKVGKALAKLKNLKAELIRRRLEGDDEFDGRGGAAPMLLVSVCA